MASERIMGGECPSCGSNKTEIVLQKREEPFGDIAGTSYRAYGACHSCGFQDTPIRAEDAELAVDIASRSFSKVYVEDSASGEHDNIDLGMEEIADEFSLIFNTMCEMHMSCHECPIATGNGSIARRSIFGLGCHTKTREEVLEAISAYYRQMGYCGQDD